MFLASLHKSISGDAAWSVFYARVFKTEINISFLPAATRISSTIKVLAVFPSL